MRPSVLILAALVASLCPRMSAGIQGAEVCPEIEGRWPYGPCRTVAVQDARAYIGNGTVFTVVDASDPLAPSQVGEVALPGLVEAIALDLPLVYVANGAGEFQVVHAGNPAAPYIFSSLKLWPDTESNITDVVHAGSFCYVVNEHELYVIDVTDPSKPVRRGWTYDTSEASSIALRGSYAVVVGFMGLYVVDLLNPDNPQVVGNWTGVTLFQPDVEVQGNYAYVSDRYGKLYTLDVYNPLAPVLVATLDSLSPAPMGVALGTGYAYLPAGTGGVHVVELTNPALPRLHYTQDTPGEARRATVAGDHLYLADGGGGMRTFVAGGVLQSLGALQTAGVPNGTCISENYLYVADSGLGLRILDLQNPGNPVEVGSVATPGTALDVAVTGNHVSGRYAVVADTGEGLRVIDVNDPHAPFEAGWRWTLNQAWSVDASWPYAYVGTGYGLDIFDLSDPVNPAYVGGFSGPGGLFDLKLSGSIVFAASGYSGVQVYSVSDPSSPQLVGSATGAEYPRRVFPHDGYLYVADTDWRTGLHIYNASDPTHLTEVASVGLPYVMDLVVSGHTALVVSQESGLHVFDVTDPSHPLEIGGSPSIGLPSSVVAWQQSAVVSTSDAGVSVFDLSAPCGVGIVGDCDGDGAVSIGEVQKAINMFLEILALGCNVDCAGDGSVSIGEVQKVINGFLGNPTTC